MTRLMRVVVVSLLPCISYVGALAGDKDSVKALTVVVWNVENLFDTEDDPDNEGDDPFSPGGWQGWSTYRYGVKLDHLASVIDKADGDIVCVQEVENRRVLDDLQEVLQNKYNRKLEHIVHREGPDHRGIDVAILSKMEPVSSRWLTPVPEQRDILVAEFRSDGCSLTVLVNHWKSRWGSKEKATRMRMTQARSAREEINRLLGADPRAAVMLVGDFNDNCDEPALIEGARSSPDLKAVLSDPAGKLLYNLHGDIPAEENGTLYYRKGKTWNSFDGISVSRAMVAPSERNGPGWKVRKDSYGIVRLAETMDEYGHPRAFRRTTNQKTGKREYVLGYSDHFPVRVVVEQLSE